MVLHLRGLNRGAYNTSTANDADISAIEFLTCTAILDKLSLVMQPNRIRGALTLVNNAIYTVE
jgi:hypothetical protein